MSRKLSQLFYTFTDEVMCLNIFIVEEVDFDKYNTKEIKMEKFPFHKQKQKKKKKLNEISSFHYKHLLT